MPPSTSLRVLLNHRMSVPGGGGLQVNKFEQVSSDSHQMSLAGSWGGPWPGEGALYSEVQCIMGNSPMARQTDRHTRLKTLPRQQLYSTKWTVPSSTQTCIHKITHWLQFKRFKKYHHQQWSTYTLRFLYNSIQSMKSQVRNFQFAILYLQTN